MEINLTKKEIDVVRGALKYYLHEATHDTENGDCTCGLRQDNPEYAPLKSAIIKIEAVRGR